MVLRSFGIAVAAVALTVSVSTSAPAQDAEDELADVLVADAPEGFDVIHDQAMPGPALLESLGVTVPEGVASQTLGYSRAWVTADAPTEPSVPADFTWGIGAWIVRFDAEEHAADAFTRLAGVLPSGRQFEVPGVADVATAQAAEGAPSAFFIVMLRGVYLIYIVSGDQTVAIDMAIRQNALAPPAAPDEPTTAEVPGGTDTGAATSQPAPPEQGQPSAGAPPDAASHEADDENGLAALPVVVAALAALGVWAGLARQRRSRCWSATVGRTG